MIIDAILRGERDAGILAEFADIRIKASKEDVVKSLQGIWRQDNLFELKQAYELYQIFKDKIMECDNQIETVLQRLVNDSDKAQNKKQKAKQKDKKQK